MRESTTPYTVANEVRMMRTNHKGTMVIVEGPSDKIAYRNLLDQNACRIVIAHGCENATGALQILEDENFDGILTIIDADFRHVEKRASPSPNLLTTDLHDLECMMMASPALDKVLSEFAEPSRLKAFEERIGRSFVDTILRNTMIIGYFRWLSLRDQLRLSFKDLSFGKFVERSDLQIDVPRLIEEVKNNSQQHGLDDRDIRSQIESLRDPQHDPWQICCGHDLVAVLSFALRRTIAARNPTDVKPEALERALRLAYESVYFRDSELYKSIRSWESANPSYKALPV